MSSLPGWACHYYSHNLPIPPFPWSACRVHLMSSLPLALGHAYYSPNLNIPPFPWSACRVHLMSSLLGWACQYYSRNLPIPAFPWSACRVHLMSSLLLALGIFFRSPSSRLFRIFRFRLKWDQ